MTLITRTFAMPNACTFSVPPIADFVLRWAQGRVVDPFARGSRIATVTNDLDPNFGTDYSLDAEDFCFLMAQLEEPFDVGIFDPPYSPRQISECYKGVGRSVGAKDTQNAALYKRVRDSLDTVIRPGGVVLSFGWSSNGMGKTRGYFIEEILLVAHGGAHNDTICMAERKAK